MQVLAALRYEISAPEIQDLAARQSLSGSDFITIYTIEYETAEDTDETLQPQPRSIYTYQTRKSYGSEYATQDYFVISVAKGMTTTLETEYTKTIGVNFGATVPYVKAEIGSSFTAKISTTYKFTGPPEGSSYNSREFRIEFYAKPVHWTQTKLFLGDAVESRTGTSYITTRYLLYSIDRKVG